MKIERVREPEDEIEVDHMSGIMDGPGRTLFYHFLNNDPYIESVMNIKPDYDAIGNAISESYCIWVELNDSRECQKIHELVKNNQRSIFEKNINEHFHDYEISYAERINWSRVEKRLPKKPTRTFSLRSILNSCSLEMESAYQLVEILLKCGMKLALIKDKIPNSETPSINQELYRKLIITHILLEEPKNLGVLCREICCNGEVVARCIDLLKQHYGITIEFNGHNLLR